MRRAVGTATALAALSLASGTPADAAGVAVATWSAATGNAACGSGINAWSCTYSMTAVDCVASGLAAFAAAAPGPCTGALAPTTVVAEPALAVGSNRAACVSDAASTGWFTFRFPAQPAFDRSFPVEVAVTDGTVSISGSVSDGTLSWSVAATFRGTCVPGQTANTAESAPGVLTVG